MIKSDALKRLLVVVSASLITAGCVTSTTTGTIPSESNDANAADLNYQLGARYYRNGNYELARDRLLLSIELNPRNAVAHYTLALTYEKLDNIRLATEAYERSVRIAPRDYNVLNAYAVFLCNQRRFDDAKSYFDRAIKVVVNDSAEVTMTNAGVCMNQKPDAVLAEQYFRAALAEKPSYGEALLQLSLLKFASEDYLGARAFLQRYMSSNIPTAGVLYLGVRIEEELGDDRARTDYSNRILREFPESPEARRILESG